MADTEECGERAFFWMAEVIAMHSEMTRETGSTATETGLLRYCIRDDTVGERRGSGVSGTESKPAWAVIGAGRTSRFILQTERSLKLGVKLGCLRFVLWQ